MVTKHVREMRDVIFRNYAASDNHGLIYSMMWAFDGSEDRAYPEHVKAIFEPYGTELCYVELIAPQEIRLKRNVSENRLKHKPSKRDIEISNRRLIDNDKNNRYISFEGKMPFENHLRIDNSNKEPEEVARLIKDTFNL